MCSSIMLVESIQWINKFAFTEKLTPPSNGVSGPDVGRAASQRAFKLHFKYLTDYWTASRGYPGHRRPENFVSKDTLCELEIL